MSQRATGIDFSGNSAHVTSAAGSRFKSCRITQQLTRPAASISVLPRTPSERPRAGNHACQEAWGRGAKLPSTQLSRMLSRVPAWVAWQVLGEVESVRPRWSYVNALGDENDVELQEIFRSLALSAEASNADTAEFKVVPMPEHFEERSQENLLRAMPWPSSSVRLLWRSVAAVLAHTRSMKRDTLHGHDVAVVDLCNAEVCVTVLELRAERKAARNFIVPKRDLPEENRFQRWSVVPFDWALCSAIVDDALDSLAFDAVWQIVSGWPVMPSIASSTQEKKEERLLLQKGEQWHEITISAPQVLHAARRTLLEGYRADDSALWERVEESSSVPRPENRHNYGKVLREFLPEWLGNLKDPPRTAIVCGDVAGVDTGAGTPLADRMVDWLIDGSPVEEVLCGVDGDADPGNTVATGCSIYGVREQLGLPTYLDTLPHFYIRGRDANGKRVKLDLLDKRVARGGEIYRNELQDAALIRSGSDEVPFRLEREGEKKRLKQKFRNAPSQDCTLSLQAEVQPAQGFARVRIVPEVEDLFHGREVTLNWDKMAPDLEEEEDRAAVPPCWEIKAERQVRAYAKPHIERYVRAVQRADWRRAKRHVKSAGEQMQSGRAYGSHPNEFVAKKLKKALGKHYEAYGRELLENYLEKPGERKKENVAWIKNFIRAATALFTETPQWARDFLREEMKRVKAMKPKEPNPKVVFLNAMGRCFSEPEEIGLIMKCMERTFCTRVQDYRARSSMESLGMNHWCKALQLIIRLNKDAVDYIERSTAEKLARYLGVQLKVERNRRGLEEPGVSKPYRHALLSICFLLRIRARYEHGDFLSNWKVNGSTAAKIHANLTKTAQPPTRWTPRNSSLASDECLQEALIRYIESRATQQDIQIIKEGHEEVSGY